MRLLAFGLTACLIASTAQAGARHWIGPKASLRVKTVRTALLTAAVVAGMHSGPDFVHETVALSRGRVDIGQATYFSKDRFTAALSRETRELIARDLRTPEWEAQVADAVASELSGDYSYYRPGLVKIGRWMILPRARNAEDLLHGDHRGVCRDKSLVLAHYLNSIGIEAEVMTVSFKTGPGHDFVRLLRQDFALDPTNPEISGLPMAEYEIRLLDGTGLEYASRPVPLEQWSREHLGSFLPSAALAQPLSE